MTEYTCDSFRFFNLFPVYFGGKGTVGSGSRFVSLFSLLFHFHLKAGFQFHDNLLIENGNLNIPPQTGQQNGGNRSRVTVEMSPGVRLQVQAVE